MSLKDFHVIFISLSVLLLIFFAYWNFTPSLSATGGSLLIGAVSLILAVSLVIYEISFIRKSQS